MSGNAPQGESPRTVISASWRRSLAAGIHPEVRAAPLVYDVGDIGDARSAHPLSELLPLLNHTLLQIADEAAHIMVVTDADGHILWRDGHREVLRHGDTIGLADGFAWSEEAVGTNGIGTALATGRPTSVYSAEHLIKVLHHWSCVGSPIIDPDSGEVLGCIDISGTTETLPPATVALVGAAARLAESHLALRMRESDERIRSRHQGRLRASGLLVTPSGRVIGGERIAVPVTGGERITLPVGGDRVVLPDGRSARVESLGDAYLIMPYGVWDTPRLSLTLLGTERPHAELDGVRVPLSLRHAEILALLASHPRGLTADQLSFLLYGDAGNPVTIRAEIHRLRAVLSGAVAAKPYRLVGEVEADVLTVREALSRGDLVTLTRLYQGPLLPRSESPALRRERDELDARVRSELLAKGSVDDLWIFAQTPTGHDDFEILEHIINRTSVNDHRHAAALVRLSADA
ncbi:transcriptional regulator [Acrocarpospora corrugata]|uniref:Transcriptional regulator n=1 Tax=Acrocarpospora corrugata TaxID=35763 RepID=A0A5M3VYY0_9ACTN|nr:helix-turn-helix domain-containing protein [Acrocarpospora corrugata]GES01150.1 transcriptional regulator [Acrocarpospora corrugata]